MADSHCPASTQLVVLCYSEFDGAYKFLGALPQIQSI